MLLQALFFDFKGWNEVLETANTATPDDVLFVWYQTDAGDMEIAPLRYAQLLCCFCLQLQIDPWIYVLCVDVFCLRHRTHSWSDACNWS
jgi:hypothetical protein